jgi:hypothetical protein
MELIARDVAQAALQAHAEGRLCAQNDISDAPFYADADYPNIVCAIGAGIPYADALKLQTECNRRGMYKINSIPDLVTSTQTIALNVMQEKHDKWSSDRRLQRDTVAQAEQAFLDYARELAQ